ncbi:MAG: amino acid ABC transporter permease [Terrimicrobiaceae bacterium]
MSWWFDRPHSPAPPAAKVVLGVAGTLLFAGLCIYFLAGSMGKWEAVLVYQTVFLKGWWLTVQLSLISLVASLLVGLLAALARRSEFLPLRGLATGYIEVVRGTPLLVLLLFLFYVVAAKFQWHDRIAVGVLALSLFSAAYIAEIVRSGIESVGASQLESARAIGLTGMQTYRFVIFPQALRHSLPPLAGQFASIIKDSSLLSILGISEFTFAAQQVNSATFSTLESFMPLAVGYLVLTIPVSLLSRQLERRLHFAT